MRRTLSTLALLGCLAALSGCDAFGARQPPACRKDQFEGQRFTVCDYLAGPAPDRTGSGMSFHLAWKGRDGRPLGSLPALKAALGPDAGRVLFAMNAGMYHPDQRPVGLLVQEGVVAAPLDTGTGQGNFYDLPNGVFWLDRTGYPRIAPGGVFTMDSQVAWASQSGPLLVWSDDFHPIIGRATRKAVRNAVAVCKAHSASFVISDEAITLGQLARYLRDGLGCSDALYLDGAVSVLWSPELGRLDDRKGLGPLLYVLKEPEG